jgi:hypothetical protein
MIQVAKKGKGVNQGIGHLGRAGNVHVSLVKCRCKKSV